MATYWDLWEFILGDWIAANSGQPGEASGACSFAFDLDQKILVRRNHATLPAAAGTVSAPHDDLMIIYPAQDAATRAVYFDNEGHVIHYTAQFAVDGTALTFLSAPEPSAPGFRLTYLRTGDDGWLVRFEMAPPGMPDAFSVYTEGRIVRPATQTATS